MMTRRSLFMSWMFGLAAAPARAEEPAALKEGEFLMLQSTQLLGATAMEICNQNESMRRYQTQKAFVTQYVEKVYPGQTVDWSVIPARLQAKGPPAQP